MGPNRRRGAGKAAAAAAARRQWKVGDLVLAKVKGFPAWPATVSEPEKWGYPADWKKVLVYFFGTQQIAFCNPADVEAFTEEKKQSLLVKRQGKGADFVRAVQEIIDSYEKSKKPDQFDDLNSGNEVTLVNGGNSMESSANFELKDQTETSEVTVTVRRDTSLASSVAPDVAKVGSLHDEEASLQQPDDNLAATAKPVITTYTSRKRSGGLRSRKRATQKKDSSVERSIRSLRRNKRFRKSPCASELDDVDSSAFVSNGSVEDDGSEIVTVDSDSLSLNEGSTVDSACKPEHSETDVDGLEADIELSKGLDFQIKAVFIKKKRKPNRKRVTNEANERPARLETEADLDAGVPGSGQNSQWACENLSERHNKDDGDEHLPLVKRARVRMGKLSSLEDHSFFSHGEEKTSDEFAVNFAEAHNGLCQVEERTSGEVAVTTLEHIGPPCKFQDDCSADKGSFSVKEALDHASPQKGCAQTLGNRPLLSIAKEHQSLGCSADGEAALPPSKRLHRALEAMSANAAEEGQACADISTLKTSINDSLCKSINRKRSSEYPGVRMNGVLTKVTARLPQLSIQGGPVPSNTVPKAVAESSDPTITQAWLWPRVGQWLRENDIVITETGTANFGIWETRFPKGVTAISQVLWGSIGYATGCLQGAALAAKELGRDRTILFTGDGSFQLTAQEVSTMIRRDLNPIIFVICNDGYTIERCIHGWDAVYNDIQNWNYKDLPAAFGARPEQYATYQIKTKDELN